MHEKYLTFAGIRGSTRKTGMSMILESLASPALEAAIEANFNEEMVYFGRGVSQGELHKTPELLWIFTGSHGFNIVLHSKLASDDSTYVHAKISEMQEFFKNRNVDFVWTTGPTTRPSNLATMLEECSFVHIRSKSGMSIDLQAMNENIHVNSDLTFTEIEDLESLKILRSIEISGFGSSDNAAQNYYDMYAHAGFGNGMPWHHYIGWLHEEPVAIASLLFHAGVAGIYGVATIPAARRQGVGAAITLHALHEARRYGYRIAILSPTEMSIAIYRRIGFQEYCRLHHYESSHRI